MRKYIQLSTASLSRFKAATAQELWQKASAEGFEGMTHNCTVEVTKAADENSFDAIFSTAVEDRHGEIVFQSFDLKAYKKNPVYLDSHRYNSIEDIIGRVRGIGIKDGALKGTIEFSMDNPKGVLAMKLAEGGFLNTSSIGFIPKEFDDKGNILKSELLEISAVSVPANPEALYDHGKSAEADTTEPIHETTDAPDPEITTEEVSGATDIDQPTSKADARGAAANVVRNMLQERQRHLKAIARGLSELQAPAEQKRKLYKSLREALKTDNDAN